MSAYRSLARAGALTATVAITGLLAAGTASAHVTANVYGKPAQQGGYTAVALRVPNEDPDAGTVKVSVAIDPEYGIGGARTQPVTGWTAKVTKTKLDEPIKNARGAEVDEVVTKISWTAKPGQEIKAGETEYREFPFTLGPLPTGIDQLVLPSQQTYEGGTVVKWAEPPAEGKELEHPAPVVELAPAEGTVVKWDEPPAEEGHHADASGVDTTARWLGGIGLAVGALGLGVGAGATLRARKAIAGARTDKDTA